MSVMPDQVVIIENWFSNQCDRHWENFYGITIQSTDNPGWIVTVSGRTVKEDKLAPLLDHILREFSAQCTFDATSMRVFAPSLSGSLSATAILLQNGVFDGEKLGAPRK